MLFDSWFCYDMFWCARIMFKKILGISLSRWIEKSMFISNICLHFTTWPWLFCISDQLFPSSSFLQNYDFGVLNLLGLECKILNLVYVAICTSPFLHFWILGGVFYQLWFWAMFCHIYVNTNTTSKVVYTVSITGNIHCSECTPKRDREVYQDFGRSFAIKSTHQQQFHISSYAKVLHASPTQ